MNKEQFSKHADKEAQICLDENFKTGANANDPDGVRAYTKTIRKYADNLDNLADIYEQENKGAK